MPTTRRDSIEEAARELGVGRSTLYRLAEKRAIPHSRIGSIYRVDVAELQEWFDLNRPRFDAASL